MICYHGPVKAALDEWAAGGGNWLKEVGLANAPLWAWPSFPKLIADPYIQVQTLHFWS